MIPIQVQIVTHNNARTLRGCLDSILDGQPGIEPRIVILDNASSDDTEVLAQQLFPEVEFIPLSHNIGFGAGQNRLLESAETEWVLILNPDVRLKTNCLPRLVKAFTQRENLGLVGPRIDDPDGHPQLSFGRFPTLWRDWLGQRHQRRILARHKTAIRRLEHQLAEPFSPDWISGACMLGRTQALREVDGFDLRFFLYMEDVDLCLRLRERGYGIGLETRARCAHDRGSSQPDLAEMRRQYRVSRLLYEEKHGSRLGSAFYRWWRSPDLDAVSRERPTVAHRESNRSGKARSQALEHDQPQGQQEQRTQ